MRLYDNKDRIAKLLETNPPRVAEMTADGELSVRSAEVLLQLKDEELATTKPPRTKTEGGTGTGTGKGGKGKGKAVVQPVAQAASPDLKDLLQNIGPDELIKALDQAAWNREQIRELVDNLAARFRAPQAKPIPDDLPIPANLQRTPPTPEHARELRRSL